MYATMIAETDQDAILAAMPYLISRMLQANIAQPYIPADYDRPQAALISTVNFLVGHDMFTNEIINTIYDTCAYSDEFGLSMDTPIGDLIDDVIRERAELINDDFDAVAEETAAIEAAQEADLARRERDHDEMLAARDAELTYADDYCLVCGYSTVHVHAEDCRMVYGH